jgi:hypothetical protein
MNVNITLVTTSTWPAEGPLLFGGILVVTDAEAGSGKPDEDESAAISRLFREDRSASAGQAADYNGVGAQTSRGGHLGRDGRGTSAAVHPAAKPDDAKPHQIQ